MKKLFVIASVSLAAVSAVPAVAGVAEAARSAASATNRAGNKADSVIRGGLQKGSQSAENATKAADGPVDRAAKKIGIPRGPTKPVNNERGTVAP
jgi:hypothetical protein